jgi:hypothetical protein
MRPGVAEMNSDLHGGEPHPRAAVWDILSVVRGRRKIGGGARR